MMINPERLENKRESRRRARMEELVVYMRGGCGGLCSPLEAALEKTGGAVAPAGGQVAEERPGLGVGGPLVGEGGGGEHGAVGEGLREGGGHEGERLGGEGGVDEAGGGEAGLEERVGEEAEEELLVADHAQQHGVAKRVHRAAEGLRAVVASGDELAEERVKVDGG